MRASWLCVGIGALASLSSVVIADPLQLGKSTIDGGGASFVAAGSLLLGGTIGQPDAGAQTAGTFTLMGGFWNSGAGGTASVSEEPTTPEQTLLPKAFRIYPASPNPSGGAMFLRFELPAAAAARVRVYDLRGGLIRTIADGELPAGRHSVSWVGADEGGTRVSAGLYFFRIEIGEYSGTQKVVVVR